MPGQPRLHREFKTGLGNLSRLSEKTNKHSNKVKKITITAPRNQSRTRLVHDSKNGQIFAKEMRKLWALHLSIRRPSTFKRALSIKIKTHLRPKF